MAICVARFIATVVVVCFIGAGFGNCTTILNKARYGIISSPEFPAPYANNLNATWTIEAEEGFQIGLYFTVFDLEDSFDENEKCPYDYVEIFDGDSVFGNVSERFCGNSNDFPEDAPVIFSQKFFSTKNKLTIQMKSDFSNDIPGKTTPFQGFQANYFVEDIDECKILSDKYENADYPETVGKCEHFCNNYPGGYYCSCKSGFALSHDRFSCTGQCANNVFVNTEGYIATPGYPGAYPKLTDCDWTIKTRPGNIIQIRFQPGFGIEGYEFDTVCPYDYVELVDTKKTTKFCNSNSPGNNSMISSYGNSMTIRFHSDESEQFSGFRLHYKATAVVCSTPPEPENGRILQTYGAVGGQLPFNSVVLFECQKGTKMSGVHKAKCLKDGTWSAKVPTCTRI